MNLILFFFLLIKFHLMCRVCKFYLIIKVEIIYKILVEETPFILALHLKTLFGETVFATESKHTFRDGDSGAVGGAPRVDLGHVVAASGDDGVRILDDSESKYNRHFTYKNSLKFG